MDIDYDDVNNKKRFNKSTNERANLSYLLKLLSDLKK